MSVVDMIKYILFFYQKSILFINIAAGQTSEEVPVHTRLSRIENARHSASARRRLNGHRSDYSSRIPFLSVPMASTTISQTSPGFMKIWGVRLLPTPPGVPVTITSPGDSGVNVEM